MTYTVIYQHPALDDHDLDAYLVDAIRSPGMLELDPRVEVIGEFYRGRQSSGEEPRFLCSWTPDRDVAQAFGRNVRSSRWLKVIATVEHDGSWIEYIGVEA